MTRRDSQTLRPLKGRKATNVKAFDRLTLRVSDLPLEVREALARAENRSEFIRAALVEYVQNQGERRELAEIRAALARIEARVAAGSGVSAPAVVPPTVPTVAKDEEEVLDLLARAVEEF